MYLYFYSVIARANKGSLVEKYLHRPNSVTASPTSTRYRLLCSLIPILRASIMTYHGPRQWTVNLPTSVERLGTP